MGIFKDDDKEMEANMNDFDGANVDTDLLSQIFADGGEEDLDQVLTENAEDLDDDLDELLNEIENIEEAAKVSAEKEAEAKASVAEEKPEENKKKDKKSSGKENKKSDSESKAAASDLGKSLTDSAKQDVLTMISEGTTVSGGMISDGSVEVMGTINGDIEAKGKVSIHGTVSGSVMASEILVDTPRLEGSLSSEGDVQVSADTIVIGDIVGASAQIAGAVKGSIDINGEVVLEETAVVKGDINAKSIQINKGAIMDGHCILSYSDINIDSIFEDKEK